MNIVELKNLSITYQGSKVAVNNVSFDVPEGSIVSIVGESGSGKSTIIRAIIGLLSGDGCISDGSLIFNGRDIREYSKEEMRKMRGEEMAMIFQDAGSYLNPKKKIGPQYIETMQAHMDISNEEAFETAKKELLKLKLPDPDRIMRSYGFQLSGGMRQRVAIAMAMTMNPKLLLADEPTSALDVTIQAQVVQEMLDLRDARGTAIIIVTHNMGVASRMSDYIAVMKNGELMEFGKRDEVIDRPKNDYTKKLLSVVPELEAV